MGKSIHDRTPCGPFERFGLLAPYTPFAAMMLATPPLAWWTDVAFNACGAWSEAIVRAMVFPCELPPERRRTDRDANLAKPLAESWDEHSGLAMLPPDT